MSTGKLPLRILYSLNGSPQYILARSQGAVPVEFIPSQGTGVASSSRSDVPPPPIYASASLKTCLNTICRSSPEIIQDRTRDFSVYLLDPLETDCAPAQANVSHSLSQQSVPLEARVAVGLGLMSWALMTDETDAIPVTGTLKVSGAGKEMLEIIFSLRETIPMQKASLPDALRTWSLPSTSVNHKGKRPVPYPPARTTTPITESDKFLEAAAIYVGPERRPPGAPPRARPEENDNGDKDVAIVEGPQRRDNPGKDPSPLLDFLAFLKAISPEIERNKALGSVLGLMHGPDGKAAQPPAELADAMTLFSDLQRASSSHQQASSSHSFHRSQSESALLSHNQHRRKSSSTDDEIVVLNKENVNPKVFRRRAERGKEHAKGLGPVASSTAPLTLSSDLPPHASSQNQPEPGMLVPSSLTPHATSQNQPESPRIVPSNQPPRRKRTLSEFMEEQESAREKEKSLKRAQYYRQPERSASEDSFMPDITIPATMSTSNPPHQPISSRKRTISCTSSPGPRVVPEFTGPLPPPRPTASASSPVRPARKPYILPVWARTDTATQPRLSDRTTQKVQLKEQEVETKKKESEERRKETRSRQWKERKTLKEGKRRRSTTPTAERQASKSTPSLVTKPGPKVPLPAPVAASGEFAVFSNEQNSRPPFAALSVGSPSRSAPQNNITPCTPPRKRRANTIATPGGPNSLFTPDANSLFTPASGSWAAGGVLDLGRRSMSPSSRMSPTQETDQSHPSRQPESEDDDDLLGQELDSAFDGLDFPPSSLPVASSDMDVQTGQIPSSSQEYDSDDSDDADAPPKQHWVGLPPSSPPPQSSPYLGASSMDDDDVEESPLATSDGDLGSEQETLDSPDTEVTNYSLEELGKLLNIDDLADFFSSPTTDNVETASLFDQFTNNNLELPSDDSSHTMKDWGLDATNPNLDFTEFWESVRPLVEGSSHPPDMNLGFEPSNAGEESIDHAKLADEVHALFSGCLV